MNLLCKKIPLSLLSVGLILGSIAFSKDLSFTTKINNFYKVSENYYGKSSTELQAKFSLTNTPCNAFTDYIATPSSLGLNETDFKNKLNNTIATEIQNESYFNVKTEACDLDEENDITFITSLEICNNTNCPDQYVLDNKVWLDEDFRPTSFHEPIWLEYYYNLPLKWDEEKSLWEITAYYARNIYADINEEAAPIAFITYSQSDELEKVTPFGKFTRYFPDQTIATEANYGENGYEGVFNAYYPSGNLFQTAHYINGKAEGNVITYHDNGQIESDIIYENGIPLDSFCTHYFDDGSIARTHTYYRGAFDGEYIDYHPNGKIKLQSLYLKGSLIGKSESFYPSGAPESIDNYSQAPYENYCQRGGEQLKYYENGQIKEKSLYKEGSQISRHTWNSNEILIRVENWSNNYTSHGEQKEWFSDGTLKKSATYMHGTKIGEFKEWDEDGDLMTVETYNNEGKPIGEHIDWSRYNKKIWLKNIYDDQGTLLFTHNYSHSYSNDGSYSERITDHQNDVTKDIKYDVTKDIKYDTEGNIISETIL